MSKELVQRLRNVSNMINMGEKIRWGEDTVLMDQAADLIERQSKIIEAVAEGSRCAERGDHAGAGRHFAEAAFLSRTTQQRETR